MFRFAVVSIDHFDETVSIAMTLFLKRQRNGIINSVKSNKFNYFKQERLYYLVTMSQCFDIQSCCCPCRMLPMFVHSFSISFSLMRIVVIALMSQIISDYGDDRDFVALGMMHFFVSMFVHKWLYHLDYLQMNNTKNKLILLPMQFLSFFLSCEHTATNDISQICLNALMC